MEKLADDGRLELLKLRLGPFDNCAYIVVDAPTKRAAIIDAPMDGERLLEAAQGLTVESILITHGHFDHIATLALLKDATGARVYAHPADANIPADEPLADGQAIAVGDLSLQVIATPGHTPGSVCFYLPGHLFSGDTLFPGGPGRTATPGDLQREIHSIVERLHPLPPAAAVQPGHGLGTTIARARAEYAAFASRPHPPGLCGDVLWAES